MTIYSELLRVALEDSDHLAIEALDDVALVAQWRSRRAALDRRGQRRETDPAPARVADLLACDVLLVELCRRFGVKHRLAEAGSAPNERERVEHVLLAEIGARPLLEA